MATSTLHQITPKINPQPNAQQHGMPLSQPSRLAQVIRVIREAAARKRAEQAAPDEKDEARHE